MMGRYQIYLGINEFLSKKKHFFNKNPPIFLLFRLYEISFRKEMDTRCILIDDHIKVDNSKILIAQLQ